MMKTEYVGRIIGEFSGFDQDMIFELDNGTKWIQARYEYWYHYEYMPQAEISFDGTAHYITVADHSVEVKRYQ